MKNILLFNLKGETIKGYYQWDSEQYIAVKDIVVNDDTYFHFCHTDSERALVVKPCTKDGKTVAKVPDQLLQVPKTLVVYLYQMNENNGNNTIFASRIPITPRPKPDGYCHTDTEILRYENLDERIKILEGNSSDLEQPRWGRADFMELERIEYDQVSGFQKEMSREYFDTLMSKFVKGVLYNEKSGDTVEIEIDVNSIEHKDMHVPSFDPEADIAPCFWLPWDYDRIDTGYNTLILMGSEITTIPKEYVESHIKSVNGKYPDENGNVEVETGGTGGTGGIKTVNGIAPDENGNVNIATGTGGRYYSSLSQAVKDINNGITGGSAVAKKSDKAYVNKADNGRTFVKLLDDVSVVEQIDFVKDMDLLLNGKTIYLTTEDSFLNFVVDTDCTIDGSVEGSAIRKEDLVFTKEKQKAIYTEGMLKVIGGTYSVAASSEYSCYVIYDAGGLEIDGAEVLLSVSANVSGTNSTIVTNTGNPSCIIRNSKISVESNGLARCVSTGANKTLIEKTELSARSNKRAFGVYTATHDCSVIDSSINVVASDSDDNDSKYVKAYGAYVYGKITVKNCTIFADAPGAHGEEDAAIGIVTFKMEGYTSTLICVDSVVTGTHSAVQCDGSLFIKGGTFSGYSHGGFYIVNDPEDYTYINDVKIRYGVYDGEFTDVFKGNTVTKGGGSYFGSGHGSTSKGISVYMDGCTFESEPGEDSGEAFVVRPAGGGAVNTMYISNTAIPSDASIRLNVEDTDGTAEMKIGINCNFNVDHVQSAGKDKTEETGRLYRRLLDDTDLDGRDFTALVEYSDHSTDNGTMGDVAAALDRIIAMQEELINS